MAVGTQVGIVVAVGVTRVWLTGVAFLLRASQNMLLPTITTTITATHASTRPGVLLPGNPGGWFGACSVDVLTKTTPASQIFLGLPRWPPIVYSVFSNHICCACF